MSLNMAFDDWMAAANPAMAVVTAAADGRRDGCLVGFHSQCSIEPVRYAVWLSRANLTYELALAADHLAVHLLSRRDGDLAVLFGATTGDHRDKLAGCGWHPGPFGTVLVDRLPRLFVGERVRVVDEAGDHVGIVLEPVHAEMPDGAASVLHLDGASDLAPGHDATDRR